MRALASHQCGLGSIPRPELSLCWFSSLFRGFFSGFSGFLPLLKTNIQLNPAHCKPCCKVTHGPYSGWQRRHCKLSVRPCWAASLLYLLFIIYLLFIYYLFIIIIIIIIIIIVIIIPGGKCVHYLEWILRVLKTLFRIDENISFAPISIKVYARSTIS